MGGETKITPEQEKIIEAKLNETIEKVRLAGMKAGAKAILGSILQMCKEERSVGYIRKYCETSLGLKGFLDDGQNKKN